MPKRADNTPVETEKGFGTGLRTKLEGRRPAADSADPSAEGAAQEPSATQEPAPAPPEVSEIEQLWSELEESLAREEALRLQLDEQAKSVEETRELARNLGERGEALVRREQELEAQIRALEEERDRPEPQAPEHGRAYLRRRVEEDGEALWRVFQEALTATKANGLPDFRLRLLAASTLLAEAYGETALLSPGEQVAAARDELAGMRARRASKPR